MKLSVFLATGLALSFAAGPVCAYQYELGFQHERDTYESSDKGLTSGSKLNILSGEYYFSDVQAQQHPLALAAFWAKSSSISASLGRRTYDIYTNLTTGGNAEVQYYLPGETYFVGANYNHGFSANTGKDIYGIFAGVSPVAGLEIKALYRTDSNNFDNYVLEGQYVWEFNRQAVQLQAGTSRASYYDVDWSFTFVDAAFYFNRSASLGARYSHQTDFGKTNSYSIYGQYFCSDNLNIKLGYGSEEYGPTDTGNSYMGAIDYRF